MNPTIGAAIGYVWEITILIWIIGIFRNKRTARRGSLAHYLALLLPVAVAYLLVVSHVIPAAWLNRNLWPPSLAAETAGLLLTVLGCGFAIWARVSLGSNWSGRPSLKQGHELIVRGPYQLVRHPIYSGLLLALAGTALAVDRIPCVAGWLLLFCTFVFKLRQEEKLMLDAFPIDYPAYRRRVKALIPGVF